MVRMMHLAKDHQRKMMAKPSKVIGCPINMRTINDAAHQKAASNGSPAFMLTWLRRHHHQLHHHQVHLVIRTARLVCQSIQLLSNNRKIQAVRYPWLLQRIQPAHRKAAQAHHVKTTKRIFNERIQCSSINCVRISIVQPINPILIYFIRSNFDDTFFPLELRASKTIRMKMMSKIKHIQKYCWIKSDSFWKSKIIAVCGVLFFLHSKIAQLAVMLWNFPSLHFMWACK